jgi:phosphopantothenate synthetase
MGYGFEADMEMLTKELPKDQQGVAIDVSSFSRAARKCARQLLDLVEANKQPLTKLPQAFRLKPKLHEKVCCVVINTLNNAFLKSCFVMNLCWKCCQHFLLWLQC